MLGWLFFIMPIALFSLCVYEINITNNTLIKHESQLYSLKRIIVKKYTDSSLYHEMSNLTPEQFEKFKEVILDD